MRFKFAAMLAASLLGSQVAEAAIVFNGWDLNTGPVPSFTSSNGSYNTFLASVSTYGTYGVENFESYLPGTGYPGAYTGTATLSGTSITATTPFVGSFPVVPGSQGSPSQGTQNLLGSFTGAPDVFAFSSPIRAFGVFLNNIGDSAQPNITNISVTLDLNGGNIRTYPASSFPTYTGGGSYSTAFIGIIDDSLFNNVTINKSTTVNGSPSAEGVLYDNLTVSAVPEPGTWALLGTAAGLAGVFGLRRRRQAFA